MGSRVRVRFGVNVMIRDRCVNGMKCPRTEVTVHQFGPIYSTEIITIVQCMYNDYRVCHLIWWVRWAGE